MKNPTQPTLAYCLLYSALLWGTSLLPWVLLTALQHVKFCWLPQSPALEKQPAQSSVTAADWMSPSWALRLCFDRGVWNSWVKSSLRLHLRRRLWWWLMTGIAFKCMKEFCWISFLENDIQRTYNYQGCWEKTLLYQYFFKSLKQLPNSTQ